MQHEEVQNQIVAYRKQAALIVQYQSSTTFSSSTVNSTASNSATSNSITLK